MISCANGLSTRSDSHIYPYPTASLMLSITCAVATTTACGCAANIRGRELSRQQTARDFSFYFKNDFLNLQGEIDPGYTGIYAYWQRSSFGDRRLYDRLCRAAIESR